MLLFIIAFAAALIFGTIAIILSLVEDRAEKQRKIQEEKQRHKLYEISILKEIQDRIGYELNIEKVADIITNSLKNLFPYSTVSSLLTKEEKLVFKTNVEESVSHAFIEQVKRSMLASLSALTNQPLPSEIQETISGVILDDSNSLPMSSFFHIPLIVNNNVLGLINISSIKPGLYKEDQMTILYQITDQAASALSRLSNVLTTEKGKLMSLIGSLADGVFMVDTENKLLIINETAKNLLGIPQGKPTTPKILKAFEGRFDLTSKIEKAVTQNRSLEEKGVNLEGKTVQIFITPVFDTEKSKVLGASVLLHDITLEENLAQMKEDFTNMVVHELRAPLTVVKGASRLLTTADRKLSKEEKVKLLLTIHEQSETLLEEVSSLLDAAKIEAGRFTIQKTATNLKKLIEDKVKFFLPQAENREIALLSDIEGGLPEEILLDPVRIGQVINNLLSNSLKFTPKGGKIVVKAEKFETRGATEEYVTISVSDTGIGIPKEKQVNLFSKFFQITHPTSDLQHHLALSAGTGLGLYIVKGIVEAHNGSVSLESEPGRGTTVSVVLPLVLPKPLHLTQPLSPHFDQSLMS